MQHTEKPNSRLWDK